MKPEKQNVVIAEHCGWMQLSSHFGCWQGIWKSPIGHECTTIPDYLNDLNAMHEAEKTLTDTQRMVYISKNLWNMVPNKHIFAHYFSATAALKAEAFLKTLGKWKE